MIAGATMLASLSLIVGSLVHILRNPNLSENERTTWLVLALSMGLITLPVYWYSVVPQAKRRARVRSA